MSSTTIMVEAITNKIARDYKDTADVCLKVEANETKVLDEFSALNLHYQNELNIISIHDLKKNVDELIGRRNALKEKLQHLKQNSCGEKLKNYKTDLQLYKMLTGTIVAKSTDNMYVGVYENTTLDQQEAFEISANDPEATNKLWSILH